MNIQRHGKAKDFLHLTAELNGRPVVFFGSEPDVVGRYKSYIRQECWEAQRLMINRDPSAIFDCWPRPYKAPPEARKGHHWLLPLAAIIFLLLALGVAGGIEHPREQVQEQGL